MPRESAERNLADLLASINEELRKRNPENKSVSLLGAEIPGNLLVYATPFILLALSYYFLFHLTHLQRFVRENRALFEQFAWLPLSLEKEWGWEALFSLTKTLTDS